MEQVAGLSEHPYANGLFGWAGDEPLRPGGLALSAHAIACAEFGAGDRILDLGCGQGATSQLLLHRGCDPVGLDVAASTLDIARKQAPHLRFVVGDAGALPFATGSLRGVLAECCLSLAQDKAQVLAECHRVLAPGGRLVVTDIFSRACADANTVRESAEGMPACLANMPSKSDVIDLLKRSAFRLRCWEDHSAALKTFAARLIFEHGSTDSLWCCAGDGGRPASLSSALRQHKPGYFMLVAEPE